jgi:hypothetical protein
LHLPEFAKARPFQLKKRPESGSVPQKTSRFDQSKTVNDVSLNTAPMCPQALALTRRRKWRNLL